VVGLVFLFFVAPFSLLAVFKDAGAFNSDVSKWSTGAVTYMSNSKCTLSPSLWPRRLFRCGLKRYLLLFVVVCVVAWSFLFFVAPFSLLAVFELASAFNSDVSTWNTGAVTTMSGSKCNTLSPSLWPRHLPLWCVVEYYIYDNSSLIGSQFSHSHTFFFLLLFQSVLQQQFHTNTLRWRMGIHNRYTSIYAF
jgi:surface protein